MITMENYEGWLMRYADGALTREEREAVEAFLEQHPELREEMEEVAGVKVTPVVATLPGKERLLKKEREGFAWWRVAAAVALMALAGTTLLVLNRKPSEDGPMIAQAQPAPAVAAEPQEAETDTTYKTFKPYEPYKTHKAHKPYHPQELPAEVPLLAEEVAPQASPIPPQDTLEEIPEPSRPEPTVTVPPVINDARLATNPWLEALTASNN
jgi:hypothetical protein